MDRIQNSAVEEDTDEIKDDIKRRINKLPKKYRTSESDNFVDNQWRFHYTDENETPYNKYSKEANTRSGRSKRATRPKEENKNTCSLFIETDPLIWKHISEQVSLTRPTRE